MLNPFLWQQTIGFLWLLVTFLLLGISKANRDVLDKDIRIHDPSRMVFSEGIWWVFHTGRGIPVAFSEDGRKTWKRGVPVLGNDETASFWAPDILHVGNTWYLFYSVSSFGSQVSQIKVLKTDSILQPNWKNLGTVLESRHGDRYNAIDPCPFVDPKSGKVYLFFGSFWEGIHVTPIDLGNIGKQPAPAVTGVAGGRKMPNAIEAPYLHYRNGWYYLFANIENCCQGERSTYQVIVGRSRSVNGPYLDRSGKDLWKGGETVFLSSSGREIGPGHIGFTDDGTITYHAYFPGSVGGDARLSQRTITWCDEWPVVNFPQPLTDGIYSIKNRNSSLYLCNPQDSPDETDVLHIEQNSEKSAKGISWRFTAQANGTYTIQNVETNRFLEVMGGHLEEGDYVRQSSRTNRPESDTQLWRIVSLEDGSFQIQSYYSGKSLDVFNYSKAPGGVVVQWHWLYGENQKFSIDRRTN